MDGCNGNVYGHLPVDVLLRRCVRILHRCNFAPVLQQSYVWGTVWVMPGLMWPHGVSSCACLLTSVWSSGGSSRMKKTHWWETPKIYSFLIKTFSKFSAHVTAQVLPMCASTQTYSGHSLITGWTDVKGEFLIFLFLNTWAQFFHVDWYLPKILLFQYFASAGICNMAVTAAKKLLRLLWLYYIHLNCSLSFCFFGSYRPQLTFCLPDNITKLLNRNRYLFLLEENPFIRIRNPGLFTCKSCKTCFFLVKYRDF